jgi:hypothetical protein
MVYRLMIQLSLCPSVRQGNLGFKNMNVNSGQIRFEIENLGTVEHSLRSRARPAAGTLSTSRSLLKPGERTMLNVDLPPGEFPWRYD